MQPSSSRSACNKNSWSNPSSYDQAARRASGRARYNARRQARATIRRAEILKMWEDLGRDGWSPYNRGSQTMMADLFQVDRSTICRDMKFLRRYWQVTTCPTCDNPLHFDRINELAEQGRIKVRYGV
jgi:hypothetical protein